MRKLIAIALLAGLASCTSNTDKPAETTPPKAAEPAPTPAPEPATPPPAEPPKAAEPAKPADKPATKPADKPAPTNKPTKILVHFQTNMGNFTAELNEKEAPITVANFVGLATGEKEWTDPKSGQKSHKPYYDGLTFHRVIDGFMIQGGDPLGNGTGGPGFGIKDEYNNLKHDKVGVMAMARTGAPDSAGSQFYITVAAPTFLDGQRPPYVVFGQVTEGLDVVAKIGKTPTAAGDKPLTPVVMTKVTVERK